jgi:GT2 family glycosyltransferase
MTSLHRDAAVQLSIIIVNWRSAEFVLACVGSIRQGTTRTRYEIIVVDNASYDGCQARLAVACPNVRFVQSETNLGFAGANNLGVRSARGHMLLFLNPDTEVLDSAIDDLYSACVDSERTGVLGARLLNTDGSLQASCVQRLPTVWNQVFDADLLRSLFPRGSLWGTAALMDHQDGLAEVEAVSGACMMIRRKVFEEVGGFSDAFFMYGEDLDLCARVRRVGYRNYHDGQALIIHHGGGSSQQMQSTFSVVMMRESISLLLKRTRSGFSASLYRVVLSVAAIVRLGALLISAPVWIVGHRMTGWWAATRKWLTILAWGLGLARSATLRAGAPRSASALIARS